MNVRAATHKAALPKQGKGAPLGQGLSLHSELARFCFPSLADRQTLRLAWANSVAVLFLVIAGVGLHTPVIRIRPVAPPEEVFVPVELPPAQPEQLKPEVLNPEDVEPTFEPLPDTPVVATVVAADPAAVAFAVQVEGPVVLAPARFAAAPPPPETKQAVAPPRVVQFNPRTAREGKYPQPDYPFEAQKRGLEGTVLLYLVVNTNGVLTKVEVRETSGHTLLDRHAADCVRTRWQFPSGDNRLYTVPVIFQLK